MKKIIVLLLSLGTITTVFAQGHRTESREVIVGQGRTIYSNDHRNDKGFVTREMQIQRINREYDAKIRDVKWNRSLRNGQKKREMRRLEAERQLRIRQVNDSFSGRNRDHHY